MTPSHDRALIPRRDRDPHAAGTGDDEAARRRLLVGSALDADGAAQRSGWRDDPRRRTRPSLRDGAPVPASCSGASPRRRRGADIGAARSARAAGVPSAHVVAGPAVEPPRPGPPTPRPGAPAPAKKTKHGPQPAPGRIERASATSAPVKRASTAATTVPATTPRKRPHRPRARTGPGPPWHTAKDPPATDAHRVRRRGSPPLSTPGGRIGAGRFTPQMSPPWRTVRVRRRHRSSIGRQWMDRRSALACDPCGPRTLNTPGHRVAGRSGPSGIVSRSEGRSKQKSPDPAPPTRPVLPIRPPGGPASRGMSRSVTADRSPTSARRSGAAGALTTSHERGGGARSSGHRPPRVNPSPPTPVEPVCQSASRTSPEAAAPDPAGPPQQPSRPEQPVRPENSRSAPEQPVRPDPAGPGRASGLSRAVES